MTWSIKKIEDLWIKFFLDKKHFKLPNYSLIPKNDPSLLLINSGVACLKNYFNQKEKAPSDRLVNVQRAVRTNDIEKIGLSLRHLTLFEMLGNFSLNAYGKEKAIKYAWEFLTNKEYLNLEPNLLYITVLDEDQESYRIWKEIIKINQNHIIKLTKKYNFWDMGPGPCGPNTEIYYDRGEVYDQNKKGIDLFFQEEGNERYLEIWNLVFSEFIHNPDNTYSKLKSINVDTGAGLERIAMIMQKRKNLFETDAFSDLVKEIISFEKKEKNNQEEEDKKQNQELTTATYVIADHLRCSVMLIFDQVLPSSKKEGYILRKLIRRAMLYAKKLNINSPFLWKLVPIAISLLVDRYPEIKEKEIIIKELIKKEEENFLITLKNGHKILTNFLNQKKEDDHFFDHKLAFMLYDAYGYPIDLIVTLAEQYKLKVDQSAFTKLLNQQKGKAYFDFQKKNKEKW
jgi:alanyl-tRNA synthetase